MFTELDSSGLTDRSPDTHHLMSILTDRKPELTSLQNSYNSMEPFRIGKDVAANIRELRRVLGSRTRELSRDDLAALLNERLAPRDAVTGSGLRWWETRQGEPGVRVIAVMADLAGVAFEAFALGVPDAVENLLDPANARELNEAETSRALRKAESERREQAAKASGIRGAGKKRR